MRSVRGLPLFWKALDTVVGSATDGLSWRELLGEEWPIASRYLRPTGRLVAAIGCPSPGGEACPRTVVHLADGRIRALCGASPKECDDLDLELTDVAVMELDRARLVAEMSAALEAPSDGSHPPRHSHVIPIGRHAVVAGVACPVVLALGYPDAACAEEELQSSALMTEAGIIVLPTAATLSTSVLSRMRAAGHHLLHLDEIAGIDESGRLSLFQPTSVVLEAPRSRLLRKLKVQEQPPTLLLPPDARWPELTLRLTADEAISCTFRGTGRELTPDTLKMRNATNSEPTRAWLMLKMLAYGRGTAPVEDNDEAPGIRRQFQLLGTGLKRTFGIQDPPMRWDGKRRCYETAFVISDERPMAVRRNFEGGRRGT